MPSQMEEKSRLICQQAVILVGSGPGPPLKRKLHSEALNPPSSLEHTVMTTLIADVSGKKFDYIIIGQWS